MSHSHADSSARLDTLSANIFAGSTASGVARSPYVLRLARESELEQVFRLRYEVFYQELGASSSVSLKEGLDFDVYDPYCEHLVAVFDDKIVGTYRMLPVYNALANNLVPYCDTEFDVFPLIQKYGQGLVELGRSCVAKEHRNGVVPRLLWKSLFKYLLQKNTTAIMGCVSAQNMCDLEAYHARLWMRTQNMWHSGWNLATKMPAVNSEGTPLSECSKDSLPSLVSSIEIPPLMKAYAQLGAKVCGGPAMDREFGCADFLMIAEMAAIPERYLRFLMV